MDLKADSRRLTPSRLCTGCNHYQPAFLALFIYFVVVRMDRACTSRRLCFRPRRIRCSVRSHLPTLLQIFIRNLQTSSCQYPERSMLGSSVTKSTTTQLTGSRTIYAKSVEHAARKNTARRETAYESLAARCKSGESRATSVVECRMRLIICDNKWPSVAMSGKVVYRDPHLVRVRRMDACAQF